MGNHSHNCLSEINYSNTVDDGVDGINGEYNEIKHNKKSNLINYNNVNRTPESFDKPCPDPNIIRQTVSLENLKTPPTITANKLYQYNGELFFNGKTVDRHITFEQSTPEMLWNIVHNLNKLPSVTIVDSSNRRVEGGVITYINLNNLTVEFGASFSGKAYIN